MRKLAAGGILGFLVLSSSFAIVADGTITGTVVDDRGLPVKHIVLNYEQLDVGYGSGIPQVESDENGRFSIKIVVTRKDDGSILGGKWAIYPHHTFGPKGTDYYPSNDRFYRTERANWLKVDVTPESPDAVVQLKLAPKAGALTGRITDAVTGAPIEPYATVVVAWASDPAMRIGTNSELDGEIRRNHAPIQGKYRTLVPPDTELAVTATTIAKGYKPYTYKGTLTVGSGEDRELNIQLEPDGR